MDRIVLLYQDDDLLGTLKVTDGDFPWWYCDFEPTDKFDHFKQFFDSCHEVDPNDLDAINRKWEEFFGLELHLIHEHSGERIDDFFLHIKGGRAWYRDFPPE